MTECYEKACTEYDTHQTGNIPIKKEELLEKCKLELEKHKQTAHSLNVHIELCGNTSGWV